MLLVPCPWCGPRGSQEFRFVGDARTRPDPAATSPEEWRAYLYFEDNQDTWAVETWFHRAGCRRYFVAERHRVTNEIRATRRPAAQLRMERQR
jgi:heterotetrameric sarcosine oxidase delta subunit